MSDCPHELWQAAPRGPGLPEWFNCAHCGLSVPAFEWEALYAEDCDQSPDELRGQLTLFD